jgi:hypothetical protein
LTHIDQAFAFDVRRRGCPCGGRLNVANYPRKARGPAAIENAESWDTRLSLCCAEEGCRRRATPPSARFLGRKVYAGVVVTLACLTGGGRLKDHAKSLRTALGVSGHTVRRWMSWWRRTFVGGELWMRRRGLFMPCPSESELPESLLAAFKGTACEALISLLKFISPVTTGSVHVL